MGFRHTLLVSALLALWPPAGDAQTDSLCFRIQDIQWSADGRRLFYSAISVKCDWSDFRPDGWTVYALDLESQTVSVLSRSSLFVTASPDGRSIAVSKESDIVAIDLATGKERRLTTDPGRDSAPAWSPDGRRIAFTSDRSGTTEIYTMNADGSGQTKITDSGPYRSYGPSWSFDGEWIAFYFEKGDGKDQVYVLRPDGSGTMNVTLDEYNNIFPGWLPDGQIIYGQDRGDTTVTVVVNPVTRQKTRLWNLTSFYTRSSADGKLLAAITEDDRIVVTEWQGKPVHLDPRPASLR